MRLSVCLGRIGTLAWAGGIPGGSMVHSTCSRRRPLDSQGAQGGANGGPSGAQGPARIRMPHEVGRSSPAGVFVPSRRRRWFWRWGEPDSGSPGTFQPRPGGPVSPLTLLHPSLHSGIGARPGLENFPEQTFCSIGAGNGLPNPVNRAIPYTERC